MKVLLTKDVPNLGRSGEIKEVSDGHARNFLIPKHLALPATSQVLQKIQKEEQEKQAKIFKDLERFQNIKNKLEGKTFTIKAKSEKQNLFAAVHEKEIAQAINEKAGTEISPELIKIQSPIKTLGEHQVEIVFNSEIRTKIKLVVIK